MTSTPHEDAFAFIETRIAGLTPGGTAISVVKENQAVTNPAKTYVVLTVQSTDHQQGTLGGITNRWHLFGSALAQVFTPAASGEDRSREIADAITISFRGLQNGPSPLMSFNPPPRCEGTPVRSGSHWVRPLTIFFRLDYTA